HSPRAPRASAGERPPGPVADSRTSSNALRRQAGESPLRPADVKSLCIAPDRVELTHGVVGVGAERAAAVRDDLVLCGKFRETLRKLVDGDRERAFDVAGFVFLERAHVDEYDVAAAEALDELLAADRLDLRPEVVARRSFNLAELGDRGVSDREPE